MNKHQKIDFSFIQKTELLTTYTTRRYLYTVSHNNCQRIGEPLMFCITDSLTILKTYSQCSITLFM